MARSAIVAGLVSAAALLAVAPFGHAAPLAVAIDATLDPVGRQIAGHARLTITNVSAAPLNEVRLWLYPNHLATRAPALTDVNFHWLYPTLFSPASMTVWQVRVDEGAISAAAVHREASAAGADTVLRIDLPASLAVGAATVIDTDFVTAIPKRFGSFGCVEGRCRLMGGFYPTPQHLGAQGWQAEAAPDRAEVSLTVRAPAGWNVIANGMAARDRSGLRPVAATLSNAPYASVVADRDLHETTTQVGDTVVRYLHRERRPPPGESRLFPYVREDIPGLILSTTERALAFLQTQGLEVARPSSGAMTSGTVSAPPRPLLLIQAPLRHELVQVHGDIILVSDRIFGILPLERLRKYHQVELTRAVFKAMLDRALVGFEAPGDIDLCASALAAQLVDLFAVRGLGGIEYARDLLRPVDFIPAVDSLMYAPVIAASASYFGDVDDGDLLRDDVRRFSHRIPDGRLVYHKLQDLLGAAGMATLFRQVVDERRPLRVAAVAIFGGPLDWFWRQWLGPRPRVNYRLLSVRAERQGAGERVVVDVAREGDPVREPVEVQVRDRAGGVRDLIWNDQQPRHRFEVDLPARLASVELDPRARLVETGVGSLNSSDDPRVDNRDPRRWRLIYSGFGGLLNLSQLSANFAAIFYLKPAHDLRNGIALQAFHSESVQIGVGSNYLRYFGRQATRNRLTSAVLVGATASRLDPLFGLAAGESPRSGWRLSGRMGVEHEDRDYVFDPWRAIAFDATVSYSLTALDDGSRRSQATVGVDALRLFELAPGHVLALAAEAVATFGDLRLRSQMLSAGGPTGLRGFLADELPTRAQATARIQLRNDYLTDLNWNLWHLTSVRGLAGTLFADGAALTGCDGYGLSRAGLFADAGYSFRVLHEAFGVYQQLLSIDLAVPLNRPAHPRGCLGTTPDAVRPRFVVLVTFLPNF